MNFLIIFLVLAIYGAVAKPQGSSDGGSEDASASGNAQFNGCSGSASGSGNPNGPDCGGGPTSSSGSYTYKISAIRKEQIVPPESSMYMYYQVAPVQNLTYFVDVDTEHPMTLEIYIVGEDGEDVYATSDNNINACDNHKDGSWDFVAVSIIQKGLMPDGHCPIKHGNYDISASVDTFTVTFPEKIPCDVYSFYANLFINDKWAMQVDYSFTIKKNCIDR